MSFPTNEDADPDPTTQIAWPGARSKRKQLKQHNRSASAHASRERTQHDTGNNVTTPAAGEDSSKRRMSTRDLFNISISMAGAQIAWSVELG